MAGKPSFSFRILLLPQINPESIIACARAALFVDRPGIGVVATANNTVMARYIMFLGIRRDDWQAICLSFISRDPTCLLKQITEPTIKQLIYALGIDVALGVDP